MPPAFRPMNGWGVERRRAALAITFDNLGEAAEIEAGFWGDRPIGDHYTAAFVPTLIAALGPVKATYFVEASNVALYPQQITAWRAAGHEVGLHAWRHENWAQCSAPRRHALVRDGLAAMRSIGVEPVGFRPPGGALTSEAWDEFAEVGLLYCSDLGEGSPAVIGDMVSLPFRWRDVDGYQLEDMLAPVRIQCGDPEAPFALADWERHLADLLDEIIDTGGQRTVIFHPQFLALSPDKLEAVHRLIALARDKDIWIAPAGEIARFIATDTRGGAAMAA